MKKIFSVVLICSALVLQCFNSSAVTITIEVKDNFFDPSLVTANVGDVIQFEWIEGNHTTTSDTVPSGAEMWDAPMNSTNTTFLYTIAVSGHYHYFCTIHGQMMSGVIEASSLTAISPVTAVNAGIQLESAGSSSISIHYNFPASQNTVISLYDALGAKIQELQNGTKRAGDYVEEYPIKGIIPPGIYLLRIESGTFKTTEKIIIQ